MHVSISLFESLIVLVISGIFIVAWWGIKRLVQLNDDEAVSLKNINENLHMVSERIGKADVWMEMHSVQDDDRHKENIRTIDNLSKSIENLASYKRKHNIL